MSPSTPTDDALLSGVTVLDISQGIAGPYCGLLLRQQGARVIKVEPPKGDWVRQMGRMREGQSSVYVMCNLGKESIVLDTRTAQGRAALHQLATRADVIIQNFRPGVAVRMGLDPAALAQHNPQQVYISISGYGSTGPMAQLPALDTTVQAYTGLLRVNADANGQPRRIGLPVVDLCTALYATQCTTAALYKAARSGRGRHIELSMMQVCAALQAYLILDDAMFPEAPSNNILNAPAGIFPTQDGMIYTSMLDGAMFKRLAQAVGIDAWLQDTTLHSTEGRIPRAAELNAQLGQALAQHPTAYWEKTLKQHDVLYSPVHHPRELVDDPQALAQNLFQRTTQAGVWSNMPVPRVPGQTPGAASAATLSPPALGAHTEAVLREFSVSPI